jgi:hypothetical protein
MLILRGQRGLLHDTSLPDTANDDHFKTAGLYQRQNKLSELYGESLHTIKQTIFNAATKLVQADISSRLKPRLSSTFRK